jgi:hypothetical protein
MHRLLLCLLTCALAAQDPKSPPPKGPVEPAQRSSLADLAWRKLLGQYDQDQDGKITKAEYPRGEQAFANLDRDQDGAITRDDFDLRIAPGSPRARSRAQRGQGSKPRPKPLKPGDRAPDFELPLLGMKDTKVKLSDFAGERPVALIFGSYT